MIAVLLALSTGCTQQQPSEPAAAPATTLPPQPSATPSYDYSAWIDQGDSEIKAGRAAIDEGKAILQEAMRKPGVTPGTVTLIANSRATFTEAKTHFTAAAGYYGRANQTAPAGIRTAIGLAESIIPEVLRANQLYLDATEAASANDWYTTNDILNQANIRYQAANTSLNQALAAIMLVA